MTATLSDTSASSATPNSTRPSQERVSAFAGAALAALREVIVAHDMTYDEYAAVKQWLIDVGTSGEWPLFLDVWIESTVEAVAHRNREGSKGAILGPFYLPGQVELATPASVPRRPDEAGTPLVVTGQVRGSDGSPLGGAVVDAWQADAAGLYASFAPGVPEGNLRCRIITDAEGRYEMRTVAPAPYRIPENGPCDALINATGWSPFRPAHLHFLVSAPGRSLLTTQLFFEGGEYLDNDVATAVKPELVLSPAAADDGSLSVSYDFVLDPA